MAQPPEAGQEKIDAAVKLHRDRFPVETFANIKWPEVRPALAGEPKFRLHDRPLQLDGHGHLYVLPYFPVAWERDDRLRPVDVYASDGTLLLPVLLTSCTTEPVDPQGREWVGTITTEGNLTTVVNESGSV